MKDRQSNRSLNNITEKDHLDQWFPTGGYMDPGGLCNIIGVHIKIANCGFRVIFLWFIEQFNLGIVVTIENWNLSTILK